MKGYLWPPDTGPRTFHCADSRNSAIAEQLKLAKPTSRTAFTANEVPDTQAYKKVCVELYGRTDWVEQSRNCWPRQRLSATWLLNEVLCYVYDLERPPITRWLGEGEVARYHALTPDGRLVRHYGLGRERVEELVRVLAADPDSKRAVLSFWDRDYVTPAAETPCALSSQFLLRDGYLMSINTYRSHDFFAGVRTDAVRCAVAQQMLGVLLGADGWHAPIAFAEGSIHYYPAKNTPASVFKVAEWREPEAGSHAPDRTIQAFIKCGPKALDPWTVMDTVRRVYEGELDMLEALGVMDPFFYRLCAEFVDEQRAREAKR